MGSGPVTRSQANASTRELHPRAAKRKASISMEHGEGQRKPAKLTKAELSHAEAVDFSQNAGLPAEQSTVKAANAASRTGRNVDPVPDHVKKRLEDARRRVPRYLFRGFRPNSGGGQAGLNGPAGVIPHAFLHVCTLSSMYLFGRNKLRKLISDHLGNRRGQSPFSSWTACLSIALAYTESHPQAIIAVVDLQKLTMVAAYPVVELLNVGLANILFPEEYLLFGRVEGIGFSVLPCESWPITTPTDDFVKLPQLSLTLVELFRACLNVARPLGPDLILPFAAALVSFPGMCENYLRCYRSASRSHAGQLAKTKVSSTCNNPDELSANDSGLNNNTSSMTDDSSGNSEADVALSIERNVDEELSLLFRQDDNMTTEDHRSIQEFFDTFPAAYDSGIGHQQVNMTTSRFETLSRSTIDDMLQALEGIEIPHDYSLDPRIIGDNAYVAPFAEVRDWIMLLRVISQARWGRGGRRRASAVPE